MNRQKPVEPMRLYGLATILWLIVLMLMLSSLDIFGQTNQTVIYSELGTDNPADSIQSVKMKNDTVKTSVLEAKNPGIGIEVLAPMEIPTIVGDRLVIRDSIQSPNIFGNLVRVTDVVTNNTYTDQLNTDKVTSDSIISGSIKNSGVIHIGNLTTNKRSILIDPAQYTYSIMVTDTLANRNSRLKLAGKAIVMSDDVNERVKILPEEGQDGSGKIYLSKGAYGENKAMKVSADGLTWSIGNTANDTILKIRNNSGAEITSYYEGPYYAHRSIINPTELSVEYLNGSGVLDHSVKVGPSYISSVKGTNQYFALGNAGDNGYLELRTVQSGGDRRVVLSANSSLGGPPNISIGSRFNNGPYTYVNAGSFVFKSSNGDSSFVADTSGVKTAMFTADIPGGNQNVIVHPTGLRMLDGGVDILNIYNDGGGGTIDLVDGTMPSIITTLYPAGISTSEIFTNTLSSRISGEAIRTSSDIVFDAGKSIKVKNPYTEVISVDIDSNRAIIPRVVTDSLYVTGQTHQKSNLFSSWGTHYTDTYINDLTNKDPNGNQLIAFSHNNDLSLDVGTTTRNDTIKGRIVAEESNVYLWAKDSVFTTADAKVYGVRSSIGSFNWEALRNTVEFPEINVFGANMGIGGTKNQPKFNFYNNEFNPFIGGSSLIDTVVTYRSNRPYKYSGKLYNNFYHFYGDSHPEAKSYFGGALITDSLRTPYIKTDSIRSIGKILNANTAALLDTITKPGYFHSGFSPNIYAISNKTNWGAIIQGLRLVNDSSTTEDVNYTYSPSGRFELDLNVSKGTYVNLNALNVGGTLTTKPGTAKIPRTDWVEDVGYSNIFSGIHTRENADTISYIQNVRAKLNYEGLAGSHITTYHAMKAEYAKFFSHPYLIDTVVNYYSEVPRKSNGSKYFNNFWHFYGERRPGAKAYFGGELRTDSLILSIQDGYSLLLSGNEIKMGTGAIADPVFKADSTGNVYAERYNMNIDGTFKPIGIDGRVQESPLSEMSSMALGKTVLDIMDGTLSSAQVYINGIRKLEGSHYTVNKSTPGNYRIDFSVGHKPQSGDYVIVDFKY